MANAAYMAGRKTFTRPQAAIWTDDYTATADTVGTYAPLYVPTDATDYLICSDHNRSEITVGGVRLENRKRMINGTMRSYHVADKRTFTWSWNLLPSRAFSGEPTFDADGKLTNDVSDYTVDMGAGGADLLHWWETHTGPFWLLLSYDRPDQRTVDSYGFLASYTDPVQVYFSSFEHAIIKRGADNHDLWNVSVALEEA